MWTASRDAEIPMLFSLCSIQRHSEPKQREAGTEGAREVAP